MPITSVPLLSLRLHLYPLARNYTPPNKSMNSDPLTLGFVWLRQALPSLNGPVISDFRRHRKVLQILSSFKLWSLGMCVGGFFSSITMKGGANLESPWDTDVLSRQ